MGTDTLTDLRRAQRGDREASQRLVEENTGLIWSVVRRFFGRGVEAEDLYQIGCVGFLKAVDGFDEEYDQYYGRTYADSPDIDGRVWLASEDDLHEGTFVQVHLDGVIDGDLSGYVVEE